MNIKFQCCALIVLSIISIMLLKEKSLNLNNRRLYFRALMTCFICECFDIGSIIAIHYATYHGFSDIMTKIICKLYIVALVGQGYAGLAYITANLSSRRLQEALRKIYFAIFLFGTGIMIYTDIEYFMDGRKVYSYGNSTTCAYILAIIYILSIIIITIRHQNQITIRKRNAILLWQGCWLVAAGLQFLYPELLLIGFAAAIGMLILYIEMENPNELINRENGLFTYAALITYIKEKYFNNQPFTAISVRINYTITDIDYDMEENIQKKMVAYLKSCKHTSCFEIDDDTYTLIYQNRDQMQDSLNDIMQTINQTNSSVYGKFIIISDSTLFDDYEEFLRFHHFYENSIKEVVNAETRTIEKMRKRESIKNTIDKALEDDRVIVYYQPFYNIKEKHFTTAEALVRIIDEQGELIPPGEFIPTAEKNGQIIPLGIRVFEKVCQFLKTGKPQELGIKSIEINISAAQFDKNNPTNFIRDMIKKYDIKPEWINIEITETASNDIKHILLINMNNLIQDGITFSLDDFGTGFSNLDYFVTMPVQNIKFDYSFTQGFFNNQKTKDVVTGITQIMHNMGMTITSEGIETEEQMQAMINLGVEYIQGFYFSRPIDEDAFLAFLREKNAEYINDQTDSREKI